MGLLDLEEPSGVDAQLLLGPGQVQVGIYRTGG